MDIGLPDICGLDMTRLLKQDDQTKAIPIIAVTAFAMPRGMKREPWRAVAMPISLNR
jgi:CheY-like chemotaxis protein